MPIDMSSEQVIGFTEAPRLIPAIGGTRVHATTIWRWARVGLRGVKLEYLMIGSRCVTSREALNRFFQRLAELPPESARSRAAPSSAPITSPTRTTERRRRDVAAAKSQLTKAGI